MPYFSKQFSRKISTCRVQEKDPSWEGGNNAVRKGEKLSAQFLLTLSSVIEQSETMMGTKAMPAKAWREPASLYHHRNTIPIVKPATTTLPENRSFSGALELVRTSLSPHPQI